MKYIYTLFFLIILLSCTKDSISKNPNIYPVQFSIRINTNLPKYIGLSTPPKAIFISEQGAGIKGIILVATAYNSYKAWEAADPNTPITTCTHPLTIQGLNAQSECLSNNNEKLQYSLITGESINGFNDKQTFPLVEYRVLTSGSNITIYN